MITKTIVTAALAGGLAFGIGMPAHADDAVRSCTVERVLVTPAVPGTDAVYGTAPLISEARDAWVERILAAPATSEVSHTVHHDAVYAPRLVVDQPYVAPTAPVEEVSHLVHHPAKTETVHHEAVTETVQHPAVTKTVHHEAVTKTVHHPESVAVVHHAAVTKVVRHDAVTKVVHHDAVTHTEYTRYSYVGGKTYTEGSTPVTRPGDWQANNKKYDGSETGVVLQQGGGNASYFFWTATAVVDKAAYDATVVITPAWDETVVVTPAYDEKVVTPAWDEEVVVTEAYDEEVVVTAAWDEEVVVTEAWDEEVVVAPAYDEKVVTVEAQPGDPGQPEISHVEYDLVSEAWDETVIDVPASAAVWVEVEHPAETAVYGEAPLITPATPGTPAVWEENEDCTAVLGETPELTGTGTDGQAVAAGQGAQALAETGGAMGAVVPVTAGALALGGVVALLLGRRSRREGR